MAQFKNPYKLFLKMSLTRGPIHFNIVKNYVSAERKVIRHVINDVITNYTEPRGVDTTLDDFIRKINSILLRGVDISPYNFVRKINIIPPPES